MLLLLSLTLTVSASASGPDVLFSDPALEQAVREVLGKPSGLVSPDDLRSITELSARELGITDLTGLEYLVNLASLNLSGNKIEDLTPLQSLTGLKYLVLDANQITDISALSGLTNIEWLSLEQNAISDISPLSSLMGMQYLAVTGNSIKNVSPLAGLQNLAVLRLAANEISELRFGVLPSLYYLDLAGNKALVLIFTTEKGEMLNSYTRWHSRPGWLSLVPLAVLVMLSGCLGGGGAKYTIYGYRNRGGYGHTTPWGATVSWGRFTECSDGPRW